MSEDGPLTHVGQERWRQRVRKEEAVRAQAPRAVFSMQAATRTDNVPEKFKPLHMNPGDLSSQNENNPSDTFQRDLRAALGAQVSAPQQRLLWPETSQHAIGWFATSPAHQPPGSWAMPSRDRGTVSGNHPSQGFGWHKTAGMGAAERVRANEAQCSGRRRQESASFMALLPGVTADLPAPAPEPQHPIVSSVLQDVAKVACRITNKKRKNRKTPQRGVVVVPPPPSPGPPEDAEEFQTGGGMAAKTSTAARQLPRPNTGHEQAVGAAADRSRRFLNGPHNPWYKPSSTSDVAGFADVYTKSWGVPLFNRKKPK